MKTLFHKNMTAVALSFRLSAFGFWLAFCISLVTLHSSLFTGEAHAAPPPKPEPAGMLTIETTPPHADVFVDRVNRAQAPAELSLRPGQHLVTLRCEGYRPEHRTVTIDDGGRTSLNVQLSKITGILIAASEPAGAEVTIDGISYGATPALVTALPLGTYKLNFALAGYKTKTIEVSVKDRTPVKAFVSLTSDTATLNIACDLPDVAISLNGIPRGTAPCTIDRIPAGDAELSATAKGYKPFMQKLRLGEGETQTVTIQLEIQPASLKVVSIPENARVYVDNNFRGTTPLDIPAIDAGPHRVRVEQQGYDPNARNIELQPGEATVEEFRLASNTGTVLLTTEPDGVTVIVDGKEVGKTPPAKDQGQGISAPYPIEGLSTGNHEIKFVKPGFYEKKQEVSVERGQTTTVSAKLPRKFIPNYEVTTAQGSFKGVFESFTDEGITLETRPGVTTLFLKQNIISHRRLPDAAE
jgi:hypothetical protein